VTLTAYKTFLAIGSQAQVVRLDLWFKNNMKLCFKCISAIFNATYFHLKTISKYVNNAELTL